MHRQSATIERSRGLVPYVRLRGMDGMARSPPIVVTEATSHSHAAVLYIVTLCHVTFPVPRFQPPAVAQITYARTLSSVLSQTAPPELIRQLVDLLRSRCNVDLFTLPEGRFLTILEQRSYIEWLCNFSQE